MKTEIIVFTNLMTGVVREEVWKEARGLNISNCFLSPDGNYYTKGIIGWFNVSHLIKKV